MVHVSPTANFLFGGGDDSDIPSYDELEDDYDDIAHSEE
jgi:hypothetical protein